MCPEERCIEPNDADLAAVFSKWYTGTTEHRMHNDSAYTKISANGGVDQECLLSTCGFSAAVDPVLRSVLADFCTTVPLSAKLFAHLDDYLWIKAQYLLQTVPTTIRAKKYFMQSVFPQELISDYSCSRGGGAELFSNYSYSRGGATELISNSGHSRGRGTERP